jgi:23S rRNA (adenine2503-C2)-methyltransferase
VSQVDGSKKWLLEFPKSSKIETVLIPHEGERMTLCVSSQVGCSLGCKFCHTGSQKLLRNLNAGEIVGQFILAWNDALKLTNVVFMGQGEPLLNYRNVRDAIDIISDPDGLNFSRTRVTLSTSGIVPLIPKVGSDLRVNLAISLHAPVNELRSEIMPINNTYPLDTLMEACKAYSSTCATQRITFEYVMLNNVNDSQSLAKDLVKLIKGMNCHVNLIAFNEWPGSPFTCSPKAKIISFNNYLNQNGVVSTIRWSKGPDIMAACGQLKSMAESKAYAQTAQF